MNNMVLFNVMVFSKLARKGVAVVYWLTVNTVFHRMTVIGLISNKNGI